MFEIVKVFKIKLHPFFSTVMVLIMMVTKRFVRVSSTIVNVQKQITIVSSLTRFYLYVYMYTTTKENIMENILMNVPTLLIAVVVVVVVVFAAAAAAVDAVSRHHKDRQLDPCDADTAYNRSVTRYQQ